MIPNRLTITNFLSYGQTQTLDFSPFDLAVLSGNNGVGKSSLLEAITWCLWEQARVGSSDDLMHQGEQGMWVDFIFEHENGVYRVVRKRDKKSRGGTTTLEFQVADGKFNDLVQWQSLTEGTIKQTQEKIIKTLRLPYEIFVNSSYLRQGHADEFTVKSASERKEILAEILGLSLYDNLEEKAKLHKRESQSKLEITQMQIEHMSKEMENKTQIAQNAQDTQNEKDSIVKIIQDLEKQQKQHQQDHKQYELINQQIELERERYRKLAEQDKQDEQDKQIIESELKKLSELLTDSEKIKKSYSRYQKIQKELEDQNHRLARASQFKETLSVLEHKKVNLNQTIERIKHISDCPTCLRSMSTTESHKVIETLTKEFEKKDKPQLDKLISEINKISYDKIKHEDLRQEARDMGQVQENYQKLLVAENSKKEKEGQIKKLIEQINKNRIEAKKIEGQGIALKNQAEKLKHGYEKSQKIEIELQNERNKLQTVEGRLGELRQKLKQIDETAEKIKKWLQEIKNLQEDVDIWDELAQAFGKKGVQTLIIEQTLPVIEEKSNELLSKITEGRMKVEFVTQKAKKSVADEVIETLEIQITDEIGTRAYEMFSGGEAFRINFAIRIALAKLLAVRSGAKLEFLVIDEGFGTLDSAGRDDIVAAINSIREDFKKIIVVSHVPELKDAFQTRIEVTKNPQGSQIDVLT